jgi:hypothetical protein
VAKNLSQRHFLISLLVTLWSSWSPPRIVHILSGVIPQFLNCNGILSSKSAHAYKVCVEGRYVRTWGERNHGLLWATLPNTSRRLQRMRTLSRRYSISFYMYSSECWWLPSLQSITTEQRSNCTNL